MTESNVLNIIDDSIATFKLRLGTKYEGYVIRSSNGSTWQGFIKRTNNDEIYTYAEFGKKTLRKSVKNQHNGNTKNSAATVAKTKLFNMYKAKLTKGYKIVMEMPDNLEPHQELLFNICPEYYVEGMTMKDVRKKLREADYIIEKNARVKKSDVNKLVGWCTDDVCKMGYRNVVADIVVYEQMAIQAPMLADVYIKERLKDTMWIGLQPKFDGNRMCAQIRNDEIILFSRTCKIYDREHYNVFKEDCMTIIQAIAEEINVDPKTIMLDGELYSHRTYHASLAGTLNSLKYTPAFDEIDYNIFCFAHEKTRMIEALRALNTVRKTLELSRCKITKTKLVDTTEKNANEIVETFTTKMIEDEYEGSMIYYDKYYEFNKRCRTISKYKRILDAEGTIIDILPGKGSKANIAAKIVVESSGLISEKTGELINETVEFNATFEFDEVEADRMLRKKHKYIGKECKFRYNALHESNQPSNAVIFEIDL